MVGRQVNAYAKAPHVPALYSIEAEQSLLGSIIAIPSEFWRVSDGLSADDFFDPLHARIWTAIGGIMDRATALTLPTLYASLSADEGLAEVGGIEYLQSLRWLAPAAPTTRAFASVISDFAKRRRIVKTATEAINSAYYDKDVPCVSIADAAAEALYDGTRSTEVGSEPETLVTVAIRAATLAEIAQRNPEAARITTGLRSVDEALGGLFPGHLHILGAPPSVGKSAAVAQMGLAAARVGYPSIIFSKEMASEEIATRFLAAEIGIPANRIDEGRTRTQDIEAMATSARAYDGIPLFLDGASNLSVAQIRGRCQALKRKHGKLSLAIVDHLRLIRAADSRAPEHERLDQITKDLKALAKDLGLALLLVVTLNRELWKRSVKRPLISDLYGASAIEYNADHIWFLHREEFFLDREEPDQADQKTHDEWERKRFAAKDKAELFSAKRRGGPLSSVTLRFDAPFVRFTELDPVETSEAQEALGLP